MTHTPDIDEQVNTAIHGMTERKSVRTGVKWQLQHTPYESEVDIVSDGRVIATVEAGDGQEKVAQMMAAAPDMLEALEWYAEKVLNCRKITCEGDEARHDLDHDGGKRARMALEKARGEE